MIKNYKGYSAKVSIDEEQGTLHGEVLGLVDVVTFQGSNVEELVRAFHDSVDDYLAYCRERGEKPEKPYSGRLVLRMSSELHRAVAVAAAGSDISMNEWIVAAIERAVHSAPTADAVPASLGRTPASVAVATHR